MTAKIFILPVIRSLNAPDLPCDCEPPSEPSIARVRKRELFDLFKGPMPADAKIPYQVALDFALADKLEDAAELAGIDTEKLLNAIIVWGVGQIAKMSEKDLCASLTASS